MREILFRGKVKDNGEWVYGNLSQRDNIKKWEYFIGQNSLGYEVIPETVGQYTGLTDKNGTKIFEGDILERRHKELRNHSQRMKVQFIPVKACFAAVDIDGGNVTFISDYINNKYELEVIGDVHDNPELLEATE
ncbi:MAG: YopX family protein [Eubacterium sp.]